MNTSLSSGHLPALNDGLSLAGSSLTVANESTAAAAANRKRRRAPTHLARIDLMLRSSLHANGNTNKFVAGSLSLGAVDVLSVAEKAVVDRQLSSTSTASASASASDDEAECPPAADDDLQMVSFVSSLGAGDEYEKRSRLCAGNAYSASVHASPLPPHFHSLPRSLSGASTYSNYSNGGDKSDIPYAVSTCIHNSNNNNVNTSSDDYYDLVELECAQNGSVGSTNGKVSGGLRIGDGVFELVGDGGRECKAVNIHTQAVYHCQILKLDEYKSFVEVINRLESARQWYEEPDLDDMKNLIVPKGTETIRGENELCYVLTPDHFGNLHTLIHATLPLNNTKGITVPDYGDPAGGSGEGKALDERRIQPIFKQIVALVRFCHAVGIYFRDFRLRKFVFVDRNRTLIRINSVLDLCVGPSVNDDQMTGRHVCPAYVAPEILDVRSQKYAGRPADVWALGVLMFILLTNHYPFYDQNHAALFRRIRARRLSFPIPEKISSNARWLLHALLRLDPVDRPSAADVLHSHWLQANSSLLTENVEQCSLTTLQHISINGIDDNELTFFENDTISYNNNNNNNNNRNNSVENNNSVNRDTSQIIGSIPLERSFIVSARSTLEPPINLSFGLRSNRSMTASVDELTNTVVRQQRPRHLNLRRRAPNRNVVSTNNIAANIAAAITNSVESGQLAAASLQQAQSPADQQRPTASIVDNQPAEDLRPIIQRVAEELTINTNRTLHDQLVPNVHAKNDNKPSGAFVVGERQLRQPIQHHNRSYGPHRVQLQRLRLNIEGAQRRRAQDLASGNYQIQSAGPGVTVSPTSINTSADGGDVLTFSNSLSSSSSNLVASSR